MKLSHILILLSQLSLPAYADGPEDDNLPKVQLMGCRGACANFVPAKPVNLETPKFPHEEYGWSRVFSEGTVQLLFTIGPDGKVHDVFVVSLIGPRNFADREIDAVKTWTYQPATSDGKPVAQSVISSFNYRRDPTDRRRIQTPLEVVQALKSYPALLEQGKPEEARAKLEDVLKNVRLTVFDRATVAAPLADMAFKRGDYLEARRLSSIAIASGGWQRNASLTLIKADLMLDDIPHAMNSYHLYSPGSALPQLIETARTSADAAPVLTFQAQIPLAEDGDVYTFVPYRRSFTFQKVQGSLQKFVMACDQATMESDITSEAQWRIPDKWSGCSVYVSGAPGTKFVVMQPKE